MKNLFPGSICCSVKWNLRWECQQGASAVASVGKMHALGIVLCFLQVLTLLCACRCFIHVCMCFIRVCMCFIRAYGSLTIFRAGFSTSVFSTSHRRCKSERWVGRTRGSHCHHDIFSVPRVSAAEPFSCSELLCPKEGTGFSPPKSIAWETSFALFKKHC